MRVSRLKFVARRGDMWLAGCLFFAGLFGCGQGRPGPTSDPVWVLIPGGTYMMGYPDGEGKDDEHPMHEEKVASFFMTKSEVTVAQFKKCMDAGACWINANEARPLCNVLHDDRGDYPMNCVDWYQSLTYCAWVGGRLPSEAEWEYAAGKYKNYPWGDDTPVDCEHAAVDVPPGINCGKWNGEISPVCSRPAGNSEQGLCDMLGNLIEWNNDWFYHDYDYAKYKEVPQTYSAELKKSDYYRVMRGGGLGSREPLNARNRIFHFPAFHYEGLGFRCAK